MDEEDAKILENDEFDMGAIKAAVESFGSSTSSLKIFGDSWTTVDCGGNKKARILKDPHKAFELYGKELRVYLIT